MRFRETLIRDSAADKGYRGELWKMCARDLLFFVNAFAWTLDPRLTDRPACIPFITWDCQDKAFADIHDAIGDGADIGVEKSRDMGASWIICTVFLWEWLFHANKSFLIVSRNEDYVDCAGNYKAMFQKIDFLIEHLPKWMLPHYARTRLRLSNEDNGSSIDGESTTGDVARGDRRTAIALDEFAAFEIKDGYKALSSTQYATNCRIFNSTYEGTGNAFYDVMQKVRRKVRLHWSDHPEKSIGLHRDAKGKLRSPWYDEQCKRANHPSEIAQQLDIDPAGSGFQYYDLESIQHHVRTYGCEPYTEGDLAYAEYDCRPIEFRPLPKGPLKLWMYVDGSGKPPPGREYAIGADIASGTGASNSVLSIGDKRLGEKVGRLATPHMRPEHFAQLAVAVAKWFNNAIIVPEANGPGRNFIDAVLDTGYTNLYFRPTNEKSIDRRFSMTPGWYATKESKVSLHGEYRRALGTASIQAEFINRDIDSLRECEQLVFSPTGGVEHSGSVGTIDPSGAKENHADMPTADALCWMGMKETRRQPPRPEPVNVNNNFASRRAERVRRESELAAW